MRRKREGKGEGRTRGGKGEGRGEGMRRVGKGKGERREGNWREDPLDLPNRTYFLRGTPLYDHEEQQLYFTVFHMLPPRALHGRVVFGNVPER